VDHYLGKPYSEEELLALVPLPAAVVGGQVEVDQVAAK
jgi:hypothetical protein